MDVSRRMALRAAGTLAGAVVVDYLTPLSAQGAAQTDRLAQMRQQYGAAAIVSEKLAPSISMLNGDGFVELVFNTL